jgi:hypothetical protein
MLCTGTTARSTAGVAYISGCSTIDKNRSSMTYTVAVSFLEIHNEAINDLLDPSRLVS